MTFPVNSIDVHEQQVLRHDSTAHLWNGGAADEGFCVLADLRSLTPSEEIRNFTIAADTRVFYPEAKPTFAKSPKEADSC